MPAKFPLGQVVGTPGALEVLAASGQTPNEFLARHQNGDWGDLDDEDKRLNDEAIQDGSRIMSAYILQSGERLWIITDSDHASTCILLPDEY